MAISPEQARRNRELDREQQLDDLKVLLNLPCGLRFFKRLMDDGYLFRTTHNVVHASSAFAEGRRALVLGYLQDIVQVAPERVHELLLREPPEPQGSDNDED